MRIRLLLLLVVAGVATAFAQSGDKGDTLFVQMKSGEMYAFPRKYITKEDRTTRFLTLDLVGDTSVSYRVNDIKAEYQTRPYALPAFSTFKFNNKYNDEVFRDVDATVTPDRVTATVSSIGKWLCPSFSLNDTAAIASVNGKWQRSHANLVDFSSDVTYVLGYPGQYVFGVDTLNNEPDTTSPWLSQRVPLTADMFSSNLPGGDNEGFDMMLDGNYSTAFHSTWNVSDAEKQQIYNTSPYIDIKLADTLRTIQFSYTTRNRDNYWPIKLVLLASHDNRTWTQKRVFTAADDGLPLQASASWTSPFIDLGGEYEYLRIRCDSAGHHRYLVFAEFSLSKRVANPDYNGSSTSEVKPVMNRYGRNVNVHVDFPADKATGVPRIDINFANGMTVYDVTKKTYLPATITIAGNGLYPNMATDSVNLRGRGNSSWSDPSKPQEFEYGGQTYTWGGNDPKNPYRLKFSEKHRPFGLKNGKNWVLLANSIDNSMMTNAVGMKAANLLGTAYANHIVPVELYINGEYRGSYNFTEKVGVSNNSVDLTDESKATLLELDTYADEGQWTEATYRLPVNIKFPEFGEDSTSLTLRGVQQAFNSLTATIKDGTEISGLVDVDKLASFLMLNDLITNFEILHPKSTYLYNEQTGVEGSKWVFGPVWDLDFGYGYETEYRQGTNYYATFNETSDFYNTVSFSGSQGRGVDFFKDLRYTCESVSKACYKVFHNFMENGGIDVLCDFCEKYEQYAGASLTHNYEKWKSGDEDYTAVATRMKNWLRGRAEHIYANLTKYDIDDEPEEPVVSGIETVGDADRSMPVDVYTLDGVKVKSRVQPGDIRTGLKPGIYIVGGKKLLVR